jgi:two-component system, NtrC family, response regulator AtoC
MSRTPTLLIVDDEKATREGLRLALEEEFDVYVASNKNEAVQVMRNDSVDVLLTDLRLGSDNGMEVLDAAMAMAKPPLAVMMTAYGSVDTAVDAMRRGAWHFVTKPLNLDEVEMLLKRGLRARVLEDENRELKQVVEEKRSLKNLLGKSEVMEKTIERIEQVAPTRATVLIEGESGTGKEVVAHTIHQLSGRPAAKFVIVHCAALSPQLLESELFGHEKGAFTGAAQRRVGRFEQADGGTIFLDEIGEIDAATQVKLLRVLSERSIERVGSNTPLKIDVRLVAATNKNLRELVDRGEFREDLYFRLNVVKIEMPPLRERGEDIILLASAFLKEFAKENGRAVKPLSDEAMAVMRRYPWHGNVRELRTVIEHGVVMCNAERIGMEHLPSFLRHGFVKVPSTDGIATMQAEKGLASGGTLNLHSLEQQAIEAALARTAGNRTLAAELLGISRRTLQRKLKEPDFPGPS